MPEAKSLAQDRPRTKPAGANQSLGGIWTIAASVAFLVLTLYLGHLWVETLALEDGEKLSFKVGLWGLLITLEGFAFTLWHLYRTQSATFATQTAITKIKKDFQSLDVIVELSNARNEARMTGERLIAADWPRCAVGYQACRTALDKCLAAGANMDDQESETMKDFQTKFIFAEKLMNSKSIDDAIDVQTETLSGDLTEFSSFVVNLEYTIRSRFGG